MNETDFSKLLDDLWKIEKPEQLEQLFHVLHEVVSYRARNPNPSINYVAVAWRCKQAMRIIQLRNVKKQPPRR